MNRMKTWYGKALSCVLGLSMVLSSGMLLRDNVVRAEEDQNIPVRFEDGQPGHERDGYVKPGVVDLKKSDYVLIPEDSIYKNKVVQEVTLGGKKVSYLGWYNDDPGTRKIVYRLPGNPENLPLDMYVDTDSDIKPVVKFARQNQKAKLVFDVQDNLEAYVGADPEPKTGEVYVPVEINQDNVIRIAVSNRNVAADKRINRFIVTVNGVEVEAAFHLGNNPKKILYDIPVEADQTYNIVVKIGGLITPELTVAPGSYSRADAALAKAQEDPRFKNYLVGRAAKYFLDPEKKEDISDKNLVYRFDTSDPDNLIIDVLVDANLAGSIDYGKPYRWGMK